MRVNHFIASGIAAAALAGAPMAYAAGSGGSGSAGGGQAASSSAPSSQSGGSGQSGGAGPAPAPVQSTTQHPEVAGFKAKIIHGVAYAPADAPIQVKRAIWAGNRIRHKPYIYGGGHGVWNDSGYDCSGAVSYVLHAAGLLNSSMDSSEFESWGNHGMGHWITVYTNPAHAFVEIAGIRFDTSAEQDPNPAPGTGPRWRPLVTDSRGFMARHPASL